MSHSTHNLRFRSGGLASWSIRHPVGIVMITLAVMVLGAFVLERLSINLLPHIIYPDVRVRIIDPGVPATVMENQITRQLEEQLAITEGAISVQSRTSEGRTAVDLSFAYGKDIDVALRDASTRLDRAKRFLPTDIEPPVIYKRDPSQIPVLEYVVSSSQMSSVELRDWVDNQFSKWFLNLPGVAAIEVGGGYVREISVQPDQERLSGLGLSIEDIVSSLQRGNVESPAGRLVMRQQEIISRTSGRFTSIDEIARLPISLNSGETIRLSDIATVIDGHEDERLRVRYNDQQGVKLSIQKQPEANVVGVAEVINAQLLWLKNQNLLPQGTVVQKVNDQAVYVRNAINNASLAAVSGAILAMIVVFIFLGNIRHTLIIGSAIPIAVMVTFIIMGLGELSLNIMTLGGLALGIGMLVDNTIVMLENIARHQRDKEVVDSEYTQGLSTDAAAAVTAATEVNSAVVASTTTNLAAVLPFLFISGLVGLLFRELIFTISAAIVASLIVALTLVPALAAHTAKSQQSRFRQFVDRMMLGAQNKYVKMLGFILSTFASRIIVVLLFSAALIFSLYDISASKQIFLPSLDDGNLRISIRADQGISLNEMDASVQRIEKLLREQPEVEGVFSIVGGFIYGRSQFESSNYSTLTVQLVPSNQRRLSSEQAKSKINKQISQLNMAGIKAYVRVYGLRGLRLNRKSDDDFSIRIQGPDLTTLNDIGNEVMQRLKKVKGLSNLRNSAAEVRQELSIVVDRERASSLGLDIEDVSKAMRYALDGVVVTDYIEGDNIYDVRLRLPSARIESPQDLESVLLFSKESDRSAVYLGDVAAVQIIPSPAQIMRDRQQRVVEVTASMKNTATGEILDAADASLADLNLPLGYNLYDGGTKQALQENRQLADLLLLLAVFLVLVVMAVQYESLLNPVIILLSVPFAAIGVELGLLLTPITLSMPVFLGMIMLAGIVVNNAIVLVEYIEIQRARGKDITEAILLAARLRLRPILMTTLTTVVGMLPLALKLGEGAEMLQPLAVTIVSGLSFSLLVSLLLIPILYSAFHPAVATLRLRLAHH